MPPNISATGRVLCIGAGFSGAVIARAFADAGFVVTVVDERNHIAGNCHTETDAQTGIMVHKYGPHIFHTNRNEVWDYVNSYARFMPYTNRVKAVVKGAVFSLPINLHTINQFFKTNLSPAEAEALIRSKTRADITDPQTFEDQALAFVGSEIFQAFFRGYSIKQWGIAPDQLPASILKRLPLRFTYDDNYFSHPHQGIPELGYTHLIGKILDHSAITVLLNTPSEALKEQFDHRFYSGPIDRYFAYADGHLGYRTLDFEEERSDGDLLGTAVLNYCDEDVPWTRRTDHKYFAPWSLKKMRGSIGFREFSRSATPHDIPYYPLRLVNDKALLTRYAAHARTETGTTFVGRLGTYRYLDMDVTIGEALDVATRAIASMKSGKSPRSLYAEMT